MADKGIQIANAMVTAIAGVSSDYAAQRHWNPLACFEDPDLVGVQFLCVPKDDNSERISASASPAKQLDITVYLVCLYRPALPDTATAADDAINAAAAVRVALESQFLTLGDGSVAKWQRSTSDGHDFPSAHAGLYRKEVAMSWRIVG